MACSPPLYSTSYHIILFSLQLHIISSVFHILKLHHPFSATSLITFCSFLSSWITTSQKHSYSTMTVNESCSVQLSLLLISQQKTILYYTTMKQHTPWQPIIQRREGLLLGYKRLARFLVYTAIWCILYHSYCLPVLLSFNDAATLYKGLRSAYDFYQKLSWVELAWLNIIRRHRLSGDCWSGTNYHERLLWQVSSMIKIVPESASHRQFVDCFWRYVAESDIWLLLGDACARGLRRNGQWDIMYSQSCSCGHIQYMLCEKCAHSLEYRFRNLGDCCQ